MAADKTQLLDVRVVDLLAAQTAVDFWRMQPIAWRQRWSSSSDSLRPDIEFCLTRQHVSVPSAYHFDVRPGERDLLRGAEELQRSRIRGRNVSKPAKPRQCSASRSRCGSSRAQAQYATESPHRLEAMAIAGTGAWIVGTDRLA